MKYRVAQYVDGHIVVSEPIDIFAWAEVAGFELMKLNDNSRNRAELRGQPIFASLCGPMWDGDAVRYEDSRTNDILST